MKQTLPSIFRNESLMPISQMMDNFLKGFFDDDPFLSQLDIKKSGFPKINLIDEKDKVIIKAELAGIDKKDINIEYNNDILSISGEKKEEEKIEKKNYICQELRSGYFCRQIKIDRNFIKSEEIDASWDNGILIIKIPKKEEKIEKEEKQKIEIK